MIEKVCNLRKAVKNMSKKNKKNSKCDMPTKIAKTIEKQKKAVAKKGGKRGRQPKPGNWTPINVHLPEKMAEWLKENRTKTEQTATNAVITALTWLQRAKPEVVQKYVDIATKNGSIC